MGVWIFNNTGPPSPPPPPPKINPNKQKNQKKLIILRILQRCSQCLFWWVRFSNNSIWRSGLPTSLITPFDSFETTCITSLWKLEFTIDQGLRRDLAIFDFNLGPLGVLIKSGRDCVISEAGSWCTAMNTDEDCNEAAC